MYFSAKVILFAIRIKNGNDKKILKSVNLIREREREIKRIGKLETNKGFGGIKKVEK